jgi:hypothetical protein
MPLRMEASPISVEMAAMLFIMQLEKSLKLDFREKK